MIPVPSGVPVRLAVGRTDMRRGMNGLALQVQETFGSDPFAGGLFDSRGARGDLIKILWHDGLGLSLYAKQLERGRFVWPTVSSGSVSISPAQLGYRIDGIDWRSPQHTWRPQVAPPTGLRIIIAAPTTAWAKQLMAASMALDPAELPDQVVALRALLIAASRRAGAGAASSMSATTKSR